MLCLSILLQESHLHLFREPPCPFNFYVCCWHVESVFLAYVVSDLPAESFPQHRLIFFYNKLEMSPTCILQLKIFKSIRCVFHVRVVPGRSDCLRYWFSLIQCDNSLTFYSVLAKCQIHSCWTQRSILPLVSWGAHNRIHLDSFWW